MRQFYRNLAEDRDDNRRTLPNYITNKISEICFFLSSFNTGKTKAEYKLGHSALTWLRHRAPLAEIIVAPFPSWLLECVFFKHIFEKEYVPTRNYVFTSPMGGAYLAIFRNAIPSDLVAHISLSTNALILNNSPQQTYQTLRGEGNYFLFGFHRFSSPETMAYAHMTEPKFITWTNMMRPYFEIIRALLRKHIPTMMKLDAPHIGEENPFFPYTSGQINVNTLASAHVDKTDLSGTVNCLTTIGNYTGGELYFPDLDITLSIQPGDIIFMEGSRLKHEVRPIGVNESRTSVNMYVNCGAFIQKN
jgi:hypothetical protein